MKPIEFTLYKLDGHTVVPCENSLEWAKWLDSAWPSRVVGRTFVGQLRVSTVFIGSSNRTLFETMVFDALDEALDYQERCNTWEEAELMHKRGIEYATAQEPS